MIIFMLFYQINIKIIKTNALNFIRVNMINDSSIEHLVLNV